MKKQTPPKILAAQILASFEAGDIEATNRVECEQLIREGKHDDAAVIYGEPNYLHACERLGVASYADRQARQSAQLEATVRDVLAKGVAESLTHKLPSGRVLVLGRPMNNNERDEAATPEGIAYLEKLAETIEQAKKARGETT